ncbi:MAG: hypothetical protein RBU37_12400 [Myxococcota bacterium]|jgi:tetratricopeptide (TPR) repeat protein|nr:hypothetical protein [Myxococcota bacterium]
MLHSRQAKQGAAVSEQRGRRGVGVGRKSGVLGAVLVTLLLWSSAAFALTLEDVKRMAAAGLDDNTLISIIEKSGDKFVIDAAVQAELEAAGVSERIIKVLKATSPVTDSGPTPVTGPDPAGPEPLPAGVGNLGKVFSTAARMAKQQFDVSAGAQKRIAEQAAAQQESAKLQAAYAQVDKVLRDFDSLDKWSVLASCHNFLVEYKPAPNTDEYYHAHYCKGAAFHALGLHMLAAPILREVVMFGGERPKFVQAFDAFVESADAVAFNPATLAELDLLYIDGQSAEFRDRFRYFLGRYFMDVVGDFERAVALISQVRPEAGLLYVKSLYALGVMQASPRLNLYRTAVENFQQAIIAAEGLENNEGRDLIELGYLALARIAYEAMNYDGALYYYNKVAPTSPRYPQALFEVAWTYFLKGDHRNALGTFHSIASPYYDDHYFPDLWVLESTVYLNLCRYEEAKAALQVFRDMYLSELPALSDFIEQNKDPVALFSVLVGLMEQRETQTSLAPLFVEAMLANVEFYRMFKLVQQTDAELGQVKAVAEGLGPFGAELLKQAEKYAEAKRFEAGLKAQSILKELENELREWDVHSTEVSIEIKIAEKDVDQICLRLAAQGKPCTLTTEEETVLFLVADDWQFWPFENEYWVDEVGSYKSYLGDRCRQFEAAGTP